MDKREIKISIITVCKNEISNISFTFDSILRQSSNSFELVVLDGESKDGTLDLISYYEDKFKERNIEYKIIYNQNKGIYNAMNKGVEAAKYDYCIFINGGDGFYDDTIIEEAIKALSKYDVDVLYGDEMWFDVVSGNKSLYISNHQNLLWSCSIAHQSAFIKTNLLKKRKYVENFDWLCNGYL